ncbi:MAG TPA: ABC transporter permease [Gaiellaceae bacterium]|jgi:peptide/nickel transport system permease protein
MSALNPSMVLLERLEKRAKQRGRAHRRHATLIAGVAILGFVIVVTLAAPLLTSYNPDSIDPLSPLVPPFSPGHLLGTDQFGRDVLTRILYGGRIDLLIAFGATGVTLVAGTAIGLVSGYWGGWVDSVIMRIVDLFFAFPFLVLVIAIVAMLGPSVFNMFVAIWITSWITYARITRGHSLGLRRREYVLAAKALGYRHRRVMLRHILPNVVSFVVIFAMVDAVGNVLLGAALGFLGLGAKPPSPEWGVMISDGQSYIFTAWWLSTLPGIAIILVGVGFSLVGDGLADFLRSGD